jgi:hypothetical protein
LRRTGPLLAGVYRSLSRRLWRHSLEVALSVGGCLRDVAGCGLERGLLPYVVCRVLVWERLLARLARPGTPRRGGAVQDDAASLTPESGTKAKQRSVSVCFSHFRSSSGKVSHLGSLTWALPWRISPECAHGLALVPRFGPVANSHSVMYMCNLSWGMRMHMGKWCVQQFVNVRPMCTLLAPLSMAMYIWEWTVLQLWSATSFLPGDAPIIVGAAVSRHFSGMLEINGI